MGKRLCKQMFAGLDRLVKMVPTVKLNNNVNYPVLGLGTSQAKSGEMEKAVKEAIDMGYRHFDTAFIYGNEHEIGAAVRAKIEEGVVKREDIFVTNKLWITFQRPDLVVPACRRTIEGMGLDYVDLYLIHFPMSLKDGMGLWPKDEKGKFIPGDNDYVETWKMMEECVKEGLTKSIGISNFNTEQIGRILAVATIKPVVNQVECHPYFNQSKIITFCKERDIVVTAYGPLGRPGSNARTMKQGAPPLLEDSKLQEIAAKYKKTVAQVILRYLIQHGVVPIPKSSNPKRMRENLDIFDFELSPEDVASIDALDRNERIFTYQDFVDFKHFPFHIEF